MAEAAQEGVQTGDARGPGIKYRGALALYAGLGFHVVGQTAGVLHESTGRCLDSLAAITEW